MYRIDASRPIRRQRLDGFASGLFHFSSGHEVRHIGDRCLPHGPQTSLPSRFVRDWPGQVENRIDALIQLPLIRWHRQLMTPSPPEHWLQVREKLPVWAGAVVDPANSKNPTSRAAVNSAFMNVISHGQVMTGVVAVPDAGYHPFG
jgi:hypothetical protein